MALTAVLDAREPNVYASGGAVSRRGVASLFEGFDLVEPGVQLVHQWHPDGDTQFTDSEVAMYGGLARKG